ncbi:MAG: tetratricopeptide repeat protein, partial [Thermoanaerobaculia bacterium]
TPDERTRLELETAAVLRQLDSRGVIPSAVEGSASSSQMNPTIRGFLWGAGSFAALAALGFFVYQQANPREQGEVATGGMPGAQQQQQQAPADPMVLQVEAAVQRDPNNLGLRNQLAQLYLERENLMGVFEQTKFVLDKAPDDSRALTYQALVRLAMGDAASAQAMLEHATKSDPKNLDSWVALAWLHTQHNRLAEAERMIDEAGRQSPNDKARLDQVFADMKAHAARMKQQPAVAGNELPAGHLPVADAGEKSIQVTLDLDPSAATKTGILYVMARNPAGGPPIAVKRLQVTSFPVTIALGSADSMMGQQLPDKFRLEARLDSDGDAATKLPTDPTAMQNDVVPGAVVKLALK